jgi:hypothetical protein
MEFVKNEDEKKGGDVKVEGLPEHAVKIVMDKKLSERQVEYEKLLELVNEPVDVDNLNSWINELIDMVKCTNSCVLRIAGIYAGAGDTARGAKIMRAWNVIHSIYIDHCLSAKRFWGNSVKLKEGVKTINQIHVENLEVALHNHYFRRAYDVLSYCFKEKDVRPFSVTMIQSVSPLMPRTSEGLNNMKAPEEI